MKEFIIKMLKKEEEKKTAWKYVPTLGIDRVSGFTRLGRARLKITVHKEETIRVSVNIFCNQG